jgi:hypothetical protein
VPLELARMSEEDLYDFDFESDSEERASIGGIPNV